MSTIAIILAAGAGERFRTALPKQFHLVAGRSLLEICLERFRDHPGIDGIILVSPADRLAMAKNAVASGPFPKVIQVLAGGRTRQESSAIGVAAAPEGTENVLIHDAARALVPPEVISRVLEALAQARAVIPVLPVSDTTVRVDDAEVVTAVLDRAKLRRAQTPQGFKLEVIRRAHDQARASGFADAGDDCSLVLRFDLAPVRAVPGDPGNIKITYPSDLAIAEAIYRNS
jgi:2-C-methyl-D-erythritol 4-phosphate cytidylyltransferase